MSDEDVTNLGGKLGPRLVELIVNAVAGTQLKLGDHKNGLVQQILADFTNHISDETKEVFQGVLQQISEHPDLPDDLKPAFQTLATGRGQAFGWIVGSMASATMSAGLIDMITNLMAPVIHSIIAQNPNAVLSPEVAAQAVARAFEYTQGPRGLSYDALASGINPERFQLLVEMSRTFPTANQTQDLVNRGLWSDERGQWNLRQLGYSPDWADKMLALRDYVLSAPELATMVNRDVIDGEEAERRARHAGVDAEDFARFVEIYGEPLGPQSLGEAFRRGFIDRDRFERGIIQGPLRKEWFDVLEKLQYQRMSTVDATDAVNQGHLDIAAAQEIAQANGLDPNDLPTLLATAGAPPGVDFITEALNRGFIDEETFNAAFFESRIKNKYVHLFAEMRLRLIPQETVRLLYRNGVYSREATLDTLRKHGFSEPDAQALIALEETRQDGVTRELTRSQIVDMYEVRQIDEETALTFLIALGYSDANAQAMVQLADLKRINKYITSAVNRVKSAFLAGRMTETEASSTLDQLGIPVDMRDDLFTIWDIDRTTISKTLTPSQIRQAFNKDLIGQSDALVRLRAQGYDETDAGLFLQLTA